MPVTGYRGYVTSVTTDFCAVRFVRIAIRATACASALAILNQPRTLVAQQPLTRAEAIQLGLGASPRVVAIGADTLAAVARLRTAREYPNPSFTASYSRSVPQNHFGLEFPLDLPPIRSARVRAAESGRTSARYSFLAARAAIELDIDTMYTTAQGAELRAALSRETAADAGKLLSETKVRRDAGDASVLDVNLADVAAAQAANVASADSLEAVDTRLELQAAMGLRGDSAIVLLQDSLRSPLGSAPTDRTPIVSPPAVAAASAALTAAQQTLTFERRSVVGLPAIQLGAEGRDPTGSEKGILPTFGFVLPLPLFNRNGGAIATAHAEVTRAQADLAITRLAASAQLARAYRMLSVTQGRITRDSTVLAAATRNVAMTERAYAEGEMAIGDILEARRAQHDAQAQYVTDLVAANVGAALVRVLTANGVAQ
jgi:cobalt-zinc-cadmium efflux system outer membrane protein